MRNKILKVIKKYAIKTDTNHKEIMRDYRKLSDSEKHEEFIRMKGYAENPHI